MKKLVIAHRGASADFHENTIEAFKKAIEFGANMIELDVRRTADGVLATFHDEAIDGRELSAISFSEARGLAQHRGFQIPTLEESLKFIAGKIPVQIELKETGYEKEVADVALKVLKPEDFYVISFNFSSLKNIKKSYSHIRTLLILGSSPKRIWKSRSYLFRKTSIIKYLDGVSMDWRLWQRGWAEKFPERLAKFVWTVDDTDLFKKILSDKNITGIASNTVRQAVAARNQNG